MKRFLGVALAFALALVAATAPAARGQDTVDYFDPASKANNKLEQLRGNPWLTYRVALDCGDRFLRAALLEERGRSAPGALGPVHRPRHAGAA